ncbi:hypothetical protein SCE1572_36410 [Sorangium cellulosum So0157-2]|uniref:Uncharacterized protein n=1 Tax=Sorangium cellulosum So0157-2 TaxID=1254432 RepID=S4Y5L8_SORCE|nr:hypothetical protein SCE1572_36410 [Sorangium cellulosum So0157-2]
MADPAAIRLADPTAIRLANPATIRFADPAPTIAVSDSACDAFRKLDPISLPPRALPAVRRLPVVIRLADPAPIHLADRRPIRFAIPVAIQ